MHKKQKRQKIKERLTTAGLKKMYPWILWGFVVWLFVFVGLCRGIIGDILATPLVPDWVVPYDAQIASRVVEMTDGYPISAMNEYIARFDKRTAAYLVSIAKKESNWGKRVPVAENGRDCYNYWGFRDPDNKKGSGGHSCFESPEQAVRTVGKRINKLVYTYDRDTVREMVVWKCGSACDSEEASVQKWVSDVTFYQNEFLQNAQSTTNNSR